MVLGCFGRPEYLPTPRVAGMHLEVKQGVIGRMKNRSRDPPGLLRCTSPIGAEMGVGDM